MNLFSIFLCVQFQFRHFFLSNLTIKAEWSNSVLTVDFLQVCAICIGMCNVYVYQQVQLKPTTPKQCAQVQIITANAPFNMINIKLSNFASN